MLKLHKRQDTACCVVLKNLRQFREKSDEQILNANIGLLEIQFALAMDYGFPNWAEMKDHVIAIREKASIGENSAEVQNSSEKESAFMSLAELNKKKRDELIEMVREYMLEKTAGMGKQELVFAALKAQIEKDNDVFGEGVLEWPPMSSTAILNPPSKNHQPGMYNIRVSGRIIQRYHLRYGDIVSGRVIWRSKWCYYQLYKVEAINYEPPGIPRNQGISECSTMPSHDSNQNRKTGTENHSGYTKPLNPPKGPSRSSGESEKHGHIICTFCGKQQSDVKVLIAGPGVYICNNCVHLCHLILQKEGRNLSRS